jgi:hypothetical protein
MINPKNICISACIGFFLSFFIGLFSDVRFSSVLLRAFLFALLFGALCVGITFLYQKFLSNDNGGFSADAEPASQRASGGMVNIVVDDSNLADDGMSPKFTVLNNRADLTETPKEEAEAVSEIPVRQAFSPSEAASSSNQTVPVTDMAPPAGLGQEKEALAAEASHATAFQAMGLGEIAAASSSSSQGGGGEQLDELPDVSTMTMSNGEESASSLLSEDGIETDTEFSTGGKKMKEQPISGDTNVMAKAIQTLLAKDN